MEACALNILKELPDEMLILIFNAGFKSHILIAFAANPTDLGPPRPCGQDVVKNHIFVRPTLKHSPTEVKSSYFYADVLLLLDSWLGGKLLNENTKITKKEIAYIEGEKLKLLNAHVRYLRRGTLGSSSHNETMQELKALVEKTGGPVKKRPRPNLPESQILLDAEPDSPYSLVESDDGHACQVAHKDLWWAGDGHGGQDNWGGDQDGGEDRWGGDKDGGREDLCADQDGGEERGGGDKDCGQEDFCADQDGGQDGQDKSVGDQDGLGGPASSGNDEQADWNLSCRRLDGGIF